MSEPLIPNKGGRWVWITSLAISVLLLTIVFSFVDPQDLWQRLTSLNGFLLSAAIAFVLGEGVATAMRIQTFTGGKVAVSAALRTNAWYSLLLIILPARLGEVAAIVIFRRFLGQHMGAAIASIVTQRIYDLVILSSLTVIALFGLTDLIPRAVMFAIGGVVMVSGIAVLWQLETILTLLVRALRHFLPSLRGVQRIALQARIWVRHMFANRHIAPAILWTLIKWLCNLGAIALLILATGVELSPLNGVIIAACYNFLAIVPLQTVGGFGVGEAGLMVLLGAFAVPAAVSASVSIVVRTVLILSTVLFWMLANGAARGMESANVVANREPGL